MKILTEIIYDDNAQSPLSEYMECELIAQNERGLKVQGQKASASGKIFASLPLIITQQGEARKCKAENATHLLCYTENKIWDLFKGSVIDANHALEADLKELQTYLEGEIYHAFIYVKNKGQETLVDSCGGFYGKEAAESWVKEQVDYLEEGITFEPINGIKVELPKYVYEQMPDCVRFKIAAYGDATGQKSTLKGFDKFGNLIFKTKKIIIA